MLLNDGPDDDDEDMDTPELAAPLTELDHEELELLRRIAKRQPGAMTDAAWKRLAQLDALALREMWDRIHKRDAANARKWSRLLRQRGVDQLERKMRNPNYSPTPVEVQQWAAAIHLSQASLRTEAEWDRWYAQPLAVSLFGPQRKPSSVRRPVRRSQPRRTVGRRLARTGSGPPGRQGQSDDPDEPPPVNHAAALDAQLDVRERLVFALDELDADDPSSARFLLEGLLTDLDAAMDGLL